MAHRHLLVSSPLALLASLFVASPAWSLTQECETNEDCGTGFTCEVTQQSSGGNTGGAGGTAGTSGVPAGGGGGPSSFCGDGACTLLETSESCSEDCIEVRYCAPAECDDSSDCAEGYFCAAETPPGTGGTGPSWCGDGICTTGEDEANCAADCAVQSVCAVAWADCTTDIDCPDGFYCDLPSSGSGGVSGAGGVTGAGGFMTGGTAGTAGAEGGTGGSTAGTTAGGQAGADSSEFAAPRPEGGSGGLSEQPPPGVCLPSGSGSGGAPGTGGASSGGTGALSAGGSAGASGGSGPVDGGTGPGGSAGTSNTGSGATGSGATGSGGTGSGATGGTSSDAGGTAGSTSSGGMSGGSGGPKDGDLGGGCSYSASSSASPFGLIAGLAFLFARSRRRSARRA